MRVGVSIDNVLRNLFGQIEDVHTKYFSSEENEPIEVKDYDLERWVTFPEEEIKQGEMEFNPNFNEDEFMDSDDNVEMIKKTTKVTLEEFLYEKCTLEVFGYANELVSSAVETLNQLVLENPKHEFIIITREGGLSIPSTLFFLAKTKSTCPNIKFVTEYSKVWDHVDVMITDHPKILESKPLGKHSIIVDKEYNREFEGELRIKTIKEVDKLVLEGLETVVK